MSPEPPRTSRDEDRSRPLARVPAGMRLSAVWSEALRNLATGTSRLVIAAAVLGSALAGLSAADGSAVVSLVDDAAGYRAAGSAVSTLSSTGRVDGGACEALVGLPDAAHAGAMRRAPADLVALTMPASPIPTYEVTPGFAALLTGSMTDAGLLVSDAAAEALGITAGDLLQTSDGDAPVDATYTYPDDGRRSGLGYAVVIVTGSGTYDECWLSQWPQSPDSTGLLATVLTHQPDDPSGRDEAPVLSQLNGRLGAAMDAASLFDLRPTRALPWVALGVGALLGVVLVALRRLELASARHSKVSPHAQLLQVLLEATVIGVTAAGVMAVPMTVVIARAPVEAALTLGVIGARTAVLGAAGLVVGAVAATALVRERHLFRYFSDR